MMKNTDINARFAGLSAMQHNAKAMVNLTLSYWQSTGDGLPPMRSERQLQISGARGIEGIREIGKNEILQKVPS